MNDSRVEDLLDALLNGADPPEEPKSRVEEYLYALITGTDPPTNPTSRIEAYLAVLCEKGVSGSGSSGKSLEEFFEEYEKSGSFTVFSRFGGDNIDDLLCYDDTSNFTNMSYMFSDCSALTTVPLFDTSNVTDMTNMFYYCKALTTVPLFDTSNVTDMTNMFYYCKALTTVPLFDTSNVTNMNSMFYNCIKLTTVPLFDTSNVTNMNSMFNYDQTLTTVPLFDTSNVTNMNSMFYYCTGLTTVPCLNLTNVTSVSNILYRCWSLTECWFRNIKVNLQVGSGTSYGHLLTLESLLHLIGELVDVNESRTLTVGTANLEKLANVYVKLVTITDEMRAEDALIDQKKPFEVCESTDEGAMNIATYAKEKKWQIK